MLRILAVFILSASLSGQILTPILESPSSQCCSYYVSPTGSDAASGSKATPWLTVAKVNATTLMPGQSVGFQSGGTWRETLTPGQSGSAGLPITFTSYGAGTAPVIDQVVLGGHTFIVVSGLQFAFFDSQVGVFDSAGGLFDAH